MRQGAERIAVIGGGLGGLAAACTLAARGYRVVLFEKNAWLGGKAAVLEEAGFRFDMGPTILLMPSVLRRLFGEAGVALEERLDLVELDPQWRCFFDDGTVLDLVRDVEAMAGRLDELAPSTGAGYRAFMEVSRRLHRVSDDYFLWRSIGGVRDTFQLGGTFKPQILSDLAALRMGRSVASTVRRHLRDPRAVQMVDHFTQYVGSAPAASPAVLCGIAHMQVGEGIWYPRGGTGAVPRALARLAVELGVEVRTRTGVARLLLAGSPSHPKVVGLVTEAGEEIAVAAAVSNCDAVRTHRELVGGCKKIGARAAARFERGRRLEPACSGVVLYLGLNRRYEQLRHHAFVFSRDPEEELAAVFQRGEPAPDPTCYVCAPAVTEPGVAPAGGEALYVLVHTPYLRPGHDWQRMLPAYRRVILDKLARTAGLEDLERHIVFERALTPEDIHRRYRVLAGAIYGLASHGRMRGAFKPANRSREVEGLYLAGGSAHPGPGMPMVMMSGWIAADALDQDGVAERNAAGSTAGSLSA